jgi:hypothetical protein
VCIGRQAFVIKTPARNTRSDMDKTESLLRLFPNGNYRRLNQQAKET